MDAPADLEVAWTEDKMVVALRRRLPHHDFAGGARLLFFMTVVGVMFAHLFAPVFLLIASDLIATLLTLIYTGVLQLTAVLAVIPSSPPTGAGLSLAPSR